MSLLAKVPRYIAVAGDVPVDLFVYPTAESNLAQSARQTFQVRKSNGGAVLIGKFLNDLEGHHHHKICWPSHIAQESDSLEDVGAITELDVVTVDKKVATFKVRRRQRLITKPQWQRPSPDLNATHGLDILVLQDSGCGFTNPDDAMKLFHQVQPGLLVYHMTQRPLGTGEVWDAIRSGPRDAKSNPRSEDLVVVVSADDLRAEGIELSYGLSWEKTCEDFVEKIGKNGRLDTLVTCANLIVLFGCDAAIYHQGRQMTEPTLVFDPLRTEGSFTRQKLGDLPGLVEIFIGGFVNSIGSEYQHQTRMTKRNFVDGIKSGMSTMRRFAELGFRNREINEWPMYPQTTDMIRNKVAPDLLIAFTVPSETIASRSNLTGGTWSILHDNVGDPVQVAHHIVRKGALSAANWIPIARFGGLIVLDRSEIESFRAIFHTVREYLLGRQNKPLNIGVFGSRGSGKSFAAVHVVKAAAASCNRDIHQLRFNLSQLLNPEALSRAFNAVRECTLSGKLAIVYINGFDTELQGVRLGWLIHLLLPMHVGQVPDRGDMHHIGSAILLFGSNTTSSLEELHQIADDELDMKPRVQEFLSCLDGYVNMIGIDKVDEKDSTFPVRRAVVLRALLEEREPKLQGTNGISIDDSVLSGLLMVPSFRHGIRSLRTIISTSKVTGKNHFERGALPPMAQLHLHLDFDEFVKCSEDNTLPDDIREHMASNLHERYRKCREAMAGDEKQKKELVGKDAALKPWDLLDEEFKESTRAHIDDIPRKLRTISCYLSTKDNHRDHVEEFDECEVEELAEKEHERWNAERLSNQWHLGERDVSKRSTPFLVPWRDLSKEWQDVDRTLVRSYPSILPSDWFIYRAAKLTEPEPASPLSSRKAKTM